MYSNILHHVHTPILWDHRIYFGFFASTSTELRQTLARLVVRGQNWVYEDSAKGARTILYHAILFYAILYYTILYYTSTILYYTIVYYTMLYFTILYYTIL